MNDLIQLLIESTIKQYREFYDLIVKNIKQPIGWRDWEILKTHQDFIISLDKKSMGHNEVEKVQAEFDKFTEKHIKTYFNNMEYATKKFNLQIQEDIKPPKREGEGLKDFIVGALALSVSRPAIAKRHLKNTYHTLVTMRQCLDNCGLLFSEINKRSNYELYNLIITEKTGNRKKNIPHYLIGKEQLDEYVNLFNTGKDMRINGILVEFNPKNDIFISGTKLKNVEEINSYKKLKRLSNDSAFAKSEICRVITSELIRQNEVILSPKPLKSINDVVTHGKTREALKLALDKNNLSQEDTKDLKLMLSRLNKLEIDKGKGIITHAEYKADYTQITNALIHKIEEWE